MPIRVLLEGVTVIRDGKPVRPKVGSEFNFTDKEIAEIEGTSEAAGIRPQAWKRKIVEVEDKTAAAKPAAAVVSAAKPVAAPVPAAKAADATTDGDGAAKPGDEAGL